MIILDGTIEQVQQSVLQVLGEGDRRRGGDRGRERDTCAERPPQAVADRGYVFRVSDTET